MQKIDWIQEVKRLRATGSFESTMAYLNRLLSVSPGDPQVHYQIAWTHDVLGKESDAVAAYEKAIELGLTGVDLEGACLGLGSTYRCLGMYEKSKLALQKGIDQFPENGALKTFLAMTLYNLGEHNKAMEIMLKELVRVTQDPTILNYRRAILNYSDKLDEKFE